MAQSNWDHQTIWTGDNLDIMRGMNSESVDLIYLDPPFNSNANYAAPIGSVAAGAEFKDTWGLNDINLAWHGLIKDEHPGLYDLLNAVVNIHGKSMMAYLIYMAIRIMEMYRLLKPDGSIYLHCDPTASHYLKLLMDSVFGQKVFCNEIIWCYKTGGRAKHRFPQKHDTILWYKRGEKATFNYDSVSIPRDFSTMHEPVFKDENGRSYQRNFKAGKEYKYYIDKGVLPNDYWTDIPAINPSAKERTGYPTQKPLTLLERIIKASSNEDNMVLDPFCGCATACIAAEQLNRQWVGIDISSKAADLVQDRMRDELGLFYEIVHRTDIPRRTDLGDIPKYNSPENKKYLYGEQGGYCFGCQNHFMIQHLTIDHIIPRSKGGTDHISNLQLLCSNCNSIKGNRTQEELLIRLTDKGYLKKVKSTSKMDAQNLV